MWLVVVCVCVCDVPSSLGIVVSMLPTKAENPGGREQGGDRGVGGEGGELSTLTPSFTITVAEEVHGQRLQTLPLFLRLFSFKSGNLGWKFNIAIWV